MKRFATLLLPLCCFYQAAIASNTVAEAYLLQGKRYADKGQLKEARQCFFEALDAAKGGPEDGEVAAMYNNLGEIERRMASQGYEGQQLLEAAKDHLAESIRIKERIYGKDSLNNARPIDNLARVYYELNELALSESLYRKALSIRDLKQGPGSADCLEELFYLSKIAYQQARISEAEQLLRKNINIASRSYGSASTAVAKAQRELAKVLFEEGKLNDAKRCVAAARKTFTLKSGYGSPESVDCMDLERKIDERLRGQKQ